MGDVKEKRKAPAWLLLVMSLVVALGCVGVWGASSAFADDKNLNNMSFARLTSAASAYFDWATNAAASDRPNLPDGNLSLAQAGVMIGYQDKDWDLLDIFNWNISELTSGAQGRGYTGSVSGPASIHQSAEQYMAYGFGLNALGLDSTANQSFDIMLVARAISGIPVLIGYVASLSVDVVFAFIIWLLLFLNPFSWFLGPASVIDSHRMGSYMDSARNNDPLGVFSGIRDTVTDLYNMMDSMAWSVIVPIFFAITVISLIMFSSARKQAGTKIRKFATYALFVILGIPLLGGTYTWALSMMGESFGLDPNTHELKLQPNGTMDGTYVIASTFCDFEGWASQTNMAWPTGCAMTIQVQPNNSPAVVSNTPVRTLCRKINSSAGLGGLESGGSGEDKWNNAAYNASGNLDYSSNNNIGIMFEMLLRYMSGSFYTASDYETAVKSHIGQDDGLTAEMKDFNDYKKWNDSTPWNGSLWRLIGPNSMTGTGGNIAGFLRGNGDLTGPGSAVQIGPSGGSLTTLATYNYLRTTFEGSSVNVFQPEKAVNLGSNPAHRSVNLIGTGLMCPLYWLNSIVMLYVLTIIGWAYAMPILFSNIRRSIQMVISVPFAMIGMLKSAARVVTLTLMMILEVLVTMFAYQLVKVLLMSLNNVIEIYASNALQTAWGTIQALMVVVSPLTMMIGILVNIWFCVMAVRLRKMLVKSIDEMMASAVNRLFAADGGMPGGASKPGLVKGAVGAAGAGAMMMAGNAGANMVNDKVSGSSLGQKMGIGKSKDEATSAGDGKKVGDLPGGGAIEGGAAQKIPGLDGPLGGGGGALPVASNAVDKKDSDIIDVEGHAVSASDQDASTTDSKKPNTFSVPDGQQAHDTAVASGVSSSKNERTSKKSASEAKAENAMNNITGKVDAVSAESNKETQKKMAAQQRKEAVKDGVVGGAKTVKGAAETYVGAQTGNAKLAEKGVKDAADGASKMGRAADKGAHAGNDSKVAVAQASNVSVKSGGDGTVGQSAEQKAQADTARRIQAQEAVDRIDNRVEFEEKNQAQNTEQNRVATDTSAKQNVESTSTDRTDARTALNADMSSKPDIRSSASDGAQSRLNTDGGSKTATDAAKIAQSATGATDAKSATHKVPTAEMGKSVSVGANGAAPKSVMNQSVSSTTTASSTQSTNVAGDKSVSTSGATTNVARSGDTRADVSQKQNVAQSSVATMSQKSSSVTNAATKVDASKTSNVVAKEGAVKNVVSTAAPKSNAVNAARSVKSAQGNAVSRSAISQQRPAVPQRGVQQQASQARVQQETRQTIQPKAIPQSAPKRASSQQVRSQGVQQTPAQNETVRKRKLRDSAKEDGDKYI